MRNLNDINKFKSRLLDRKNRCKEENKNFVLNDNEKSKLKDSLDYLEKEFIKKSRIKDDLQEQIKAINGDFETIRDIKYILESLDEVIKDAEIPDDVEEQEQTNDDDSVEEQEQVNSYDNVEEQDQANEEQEQSNNDSNSSYGNTSYANKW